MRSTLLLTSLIFSTQAFAFFDEEVMTCGEVDQRVPYENLRIGRTRGPDPTKSGCTATLISKNCLITAGHCKELLSTVEFDVPRLGGWEPVSASLKNTYPIDQNSIISHDEGIGNDWTVFKVQKNKLTGKLPGELAGFYKVNFSMPLPGEEVSIAGYGVDWREDMKRNFTLQIAYGTVENVTNDNYGSTLKLPRLTYRIDTAGGVSGAAVLRKSDNSIIGIHTNGGCDQNNPNSGLPLSTVSEFQAAILECLK